jgi:hypothetical protein
VIYRYFIVGFDLKKNTLKAKLSIDNLNKIL